MKTTLFSVDYNQFRNVINQNCAQKVQHHGDTTFLYSPEDRIIAAMKSAKIDETGRCLPISYFVNPSAYN